MSFIDDVQIGERVRSLRLAAEERQIDLAEVLDLDQATMSRIEAGTRSLTARELVLLSRHYGVATATFMEAEREPALLRKGEAGSEQADEALRVFHKNIDSYFGARALAR
jgi:transcriptional regulator with XRE-family HTH domain